MGIVMTDSLMRRLDPEAYIEFEHGYAPGPVTITRIKVVRDPERRYYHYEDDKGNRVTGQQVEDMLLAHNRADLRVHDGEHKTGICRFSFRGFFTTGRYV